MPALVIVEAPGRADPEQTDAAHKHYAACVDVGRVLRNEKDAADKEKQGCDQAAKELGPPEVEVDPHGLEHAELIQAGLRAGEGHECHVGAGRKPHVLCFNKVRTSMGLPHSAYHSIALGEKQGHRGRTIGPSRSVHREG